MGARDGHERETLIRHRHSECRHNGHRLIVEVNRLEGPPDGVQEIGGIGQNLRAPHRDQRRKA